MSPHTSTTTISTTFSSCRHTTSTSTSTGTTNTTSTHPQPANPSRRRPSLLNRIFNTTSTSHSHNTNTPIAISSSASPSRMTSGFCPSCTELYALYNLPAPKGEEMISLFRERNGYMGAVLPALMCDGSLGLVRDEGLGVGLFSDQNTPSPLAHSDSADSICTLFPGAEGEEDKRLVDVDEFGNEVLGQEKGKKKALDAGVRGLEEVELAEGGLASNGDGGGELKERANMPAVGLRK